MKSNDNCLGCGFLAWITWVGESLTTVYWSCLKYGGPQQVALRQPLLMGVAPERMTMFCYEEETD